MNTCKTLTALCLLLVSVQAGATGRGSESPTWLARAVSEELLMVATPAPEPVFGNPQTTPGPTPSPVPTVPVVPMERSRPPR